MAKLVLTSRQWLPLIRTLVLYHVLISLAQLAKAGG